MADLEKIAEDLSSLTVLEAADLAKILEEKWGVSAAAPVAVAAVSDGGDAPASAEAKTEFSIFTYSLSPLPKHGLISCKFSNDRLAGPGVNNILLLL